MTFDGIPRPGQINPYGDPLNPYQAAYGAARENRAAPEVKSPKKAYGPNSANKHRNPLETDGEDEHEPEEFFSEEEREQILIFAKLRGLMNFSMQTGVRYHLHINPETGLVDLIAGDTGAVVLSLTPQELMGLSDKIHRYAGLLTDQEG
jgi:uncharacterized FlaG/YvyC family protein